MTSPIGQFHAGGRDTEVAAAVSMSPHLASLRERVLVLLLDHPGGLTDDEGGELLNGDRLLFGRRRHELVELGLVEDSGERRQTPHGRSAIVWQLA